MENYIKIEQKLGFDKIKESLVLRCSTRYARERVESEKVSSNPATIEKRLALTDEMRLICMFEPSFPSDGYIDSIDYLKPLETESSVLSIENMRKLQIFTENLRALLGFFKKCSPEQYPNLKNMAQPVLFFPEISRRIESILDKNGEIKENATPELYRICRSINEKENSISRKIQSILRQAQQDGIADEEATVSVRDGRMLIPVSSGNKRKLQGFVYDESASGKTVFIEPAAVVELNNEVKELYFAKQREIYKILRDFSDFLRPYIGDLLNGARFVGEIDFIRAKGLTALQMEAGKPILSADNELKIVKGRHPLLEAALKKEKKEIVPLTLTLNPNKHILVISGPNAGGKSVCLKTTGILQYMFQWGLLVPASEVSEFTIFNNIFIDIGDEQSIENDLSTYSSHLTNMKELLQKADNKSLVLIDEFGSGTEPAAGGAIAETILSQMEKRGVYGIITTHYTNLKLYAGNSNGAINGAMLFDTANIKPLYKLEIGLPGNSFAFELARKIGLPENIIKEAEERAGTSYVDMEKQLRKISRNRRQLDEKLSKIKHTDKTLESITERYHKELEEIQSSKKEIIAEARDEAARIVAEANRKIEATIRKIKEAQAEKERTKLARKELEEFKLNMAQDTLSATDRKIADKMQQLIERKKRKEERKRREMEKAVGNSALNSAAADAKDAEGLSGYKKEENMQTPLEPGNKVKVKGKEIIGEIIKIEGSYISISVGNIISKVDKESIERISNREFNAVMGKQPKPMSNIHTAGLSERRLNFKPSIDIRGERLADALGIVNKFIDDALMVGINQVKILHGKGNGILKEEIRKYLKTIPGVAECKDEDIRYGGSGITIVTFDN